MAGGISSKTNFHLVAMNSTFTNNSALTGAVLNVNFNSSGGAVAAEMSRCSFEGNHASGLHILVNYAPYTPLYSDSIPPLTPHRNGFAAGPTTDPASVNISYAYAEAAGACRICIHR